MSTSDAKEYLAGHAEFSAYIAIDPDLEIFRRFTRLSARNILYLQSELASLEAWFDDFDEQDQQKLLHATQNERIDILLQNQNWESFVVLAEAKSTEEEKRQAAKMKQILKLRHVIGQYQDALVRQNACLSLQAPGKKALRAFGDWCSNKRPFLDREVEMLVDPEDLICLKKADESDRLSRMLRDNMGFLLGYIFEERHHYPPSWGRVFLFREKSVERVIAVISVTIAALLLLGSILALHFERRQEVRLGLVGVFTFLFAASVGLLTNARRAELFGSVAAYAAVLVVFVSGDFSS